MGSELGALDHRRKKTKKDTVLKNRSWGNGEERWSQKEAAKRKKGKYNARPKKKEDRKTKKSTQDIPREKPRNKFLRLRMWRGKKKKKKTRKRCLRGGGGEGSVVPTMAMASTRPNWKDGGKKELSF